MRFVKLLLLFFFLWVAVPYSFSQESCAASLQKAQQLFNQGMIDEIYEILQPCIENGFTRNQRTEAYKLIILASLLDGDQVLAEKTMIEFLKKNPEYEIMPNDPVEFVYLFESYRTTSVFSLGLKAGGNFTNPVIKEPWVTGDYNNTVSSDKTGVGYQFGLSLNRYFTKKIFLNLEFNYFSNSYQFIDRYEKIGTFGETADFETVKFKEDIKRFDIPLSFGYEIESSLFNYYIRTGVSYSNLIKANGTPVKEVDYDSEIINGATKSVLSYRNRQLYFYHIGFGLKLKIPRGYLVSDVRYHIGLNSMVNRDKRPNTTFLSDFQYIDDDYSMNSLTFSLGYYFSFYQPKKNLK